MLVRPIGKKMMRLPVCIVAAIVFGAPVCLVVTGCSKNTKSVGPLGISYKWTSWQNVSAGASVPKSASNVFARYRTVRGASNLAPEWEYELRNSGTKPLRVKYQIQTRQADGTTNQTVENRDLPPGEVKGPWRVSAMSIERVELLEFENVLPTEASQMIHPVFLISESEALSTFDSYVNIGKTASQDNLYGEKRTLPISIDGYGDVELSVNFISPYNAARNRGFLIGKTFAASTSDPRGIADNRNSFRQQIIEKMQKGNYSADFKLELIVPPTIHLDDNARLPILKFALKNEKGEMLQLQKAPMLKLPRPQSIFPQTKAVIEFSLVDSKTHLPFLTKDMKSMTLVVTIGNVQSSLDFDL